MDVVWEDVKANLNHVEDLLKTLPESDIVVLPEMFTTAFTISAPTLAESNDSITMQTVSKWAKDYNSLFVGSFIAEDGGRYYNRAFAVFPNGNKVFYDKRHLFIGGEERIFTAGKEPVIFEYEGWNINLAICFDLRFPTWLRNKDLKYDLFQIFLLKTVFENLQHHSLYILGIYFLNQSTKVNKSLMSLMQINK